MGLSSLRPTPAAAKARFHLPDVPSLQVKSVRDLYASPEFIALATTIDEASARLHPAYQAFAAREMLLAAICRMAKSPDDAVAGAKAFAAELIKDAADSW